MNVELSSLNFAWFLDDLINSTMMDFNEGSGSNSGMGLQPLPEDDTILQLTLDLNIDEVNVTDAGVYTCGSILTDAIEIVANVTTEHTVFVQCEFNMRINLKCGTRTCTCPLHVQKSIVMESIIPCYFQDIFEIVLHCKYRSSEK